MQNLNNGYFASVPGMIKPFLIDRDTALLNDFSCCWRCLHEKPVILFGMVVGGAGTQMPSRNTSNGYHHHASIAEVSNPVIGNGMLEPAHRGK